MEGDLFRAHDDAVSRAREFDGDWIGRLKAFGLDPAEVEEVIVARWEDFKTVRQEGVITEDFVLFAAGFAEGLVAGVAFGEREH